jgi:hypothetical protein
MLRIPKIEERLVSNYVRLQQLLEPWETFTGRTMKQPNIQRMMLLKVVPPNIETKRWGYNAIKDTHVDLQRKVHEKTKMNMSS